MATIHGMHPQDTLDTVDTPAAETPAATAPVTDLQTLEKRHILSVLDSVQGDKTKAAQLLGVSRRTLERRVAEWQGA